jgi:sugar O-acyltransferase (sialic acid O-acetyltransferase NeuD family)
MKQKVIIIGNSIAADIIFGYLDADKRYEVACFAVDKEFINNKIKFGLDVLDMETLKLNFSSKEYKVVLGVGYNNINQNREAIYHRIKTMGFVIETYIHPSAVVHHGTFIGEGSMVLSNSVVEPFAKIGINSLIWSNCTIAHHSEVQDHCWIASNSVLSGEAIIKDFVFIGVNCTIVNKVTIEKLNIIGAGSLITKSTKAEEVFLSRNAEKHRFDAINYAKYFL